MRLLPLRPPPTLAALGLLSLGPVLLASSTGADGDDAPSAKEIEEAGALFARSCASCHLPPAPAHGTDEAWITQLTETA